MPVNPLFPVFLGLSLSMDAFAVSVALPFCVPSLSMRQIFRVAGAFGFFQALMPLLGWLLASLASELIAPFDHWIAFALLGFIGGKMVLEGLRPAEECDTRSDPTSGWPLLTLAIGTSIDALAVGFSFAAMNLNVWSTVGIIGSVTFALCWAGMVGARQIGRFFGKRMEVLGGLVLIGIGLKILLDHLSK
jgi:putative Mn2+ efflux pump MntP